MLQELVCVIFVQSLAYRSRHFLTEALKNMFIDANGSCHGIQLVHCTPALFGRQKNNKKSSVLVFLYLHTLDKHWVCLWYNIKQVLREAVWVICMYKTFKIFFVVVLRVFL